MISVACLSSKFSTKARFQGLPRQQAAGLKRRQRTNQVCKNVGLFDIFSGARESTAATELVDEIIVLGRPTYGGLSAGQKRKQQIAELVDELVQFGSKSPARSSKLWGEYELIYTETPSQIGGPVRSVIGIPTFLGQTIYQILDKSDNSITRINEFKTLGLLPGFSRQTGKVQIASGDQIKIKFQELEVNVGIGGVQSSTQQQEEVLNVVYVDSRICILSTPQSDKFSVFERVVFEEEPQSIQQQQQPLRLRAEAEREDENNKGSFLPFKLSLNNKKASENVGGTTVLRLPQKAALEEVEEPKTPMDEAKLSLQQFQQRLQDAKQTKKELGTQLKEISQSDREFSKVVLKLQAQVVRTEVQVENVQQQLQQIDQQEKDAYSQLGKLQNRFQQLQEPAKR
eukprot:TRINITY_DN15667_c1_g4_i1.p1 TRINITY_DN15667_c1_g4~~TRINITY_DN15667_c1_g4_i1.p1  ORF type:complete len:399 (-),score=37.70 TRINITY_DN15667_c1_g4_i1:31-1227(-)